MTPTVRRLIVSSMCSVALATVSAAQTPQTPPPSQPPPTPPQQAKPAQPTKPSTAAPMTHEGSVTLVGCLYRERDVPGRTPNIAEKAGVMEDYILADARMKSGGAAAAGKMFKLEQIADEKLRAHVGKRVEVMGRIDADDQPGAAAGRTPASPAPAQPKTNPNPGPDAIELPEFEVTSIKTIEGTCPASPTR